MVPSLAELCARTLSRDPASPAIEHEGDWIAWGAVQSLALRMAALLAAAEVPSGPVALVARNRPAALAALLGLLVAGRSVRMIHAFQPPAAIAGAIVACDPSAVIALADDLTPPVVAAMAGERIAAIALHGMTADHAPGLERGHARPDPPDGPTIAILTSGTTGPPKPFAVPHALVARYVLNQGMSLVADPTDPPFLMSFPLGNITGLYSIAASLLRGGRVVLLDRFSVEAWRRFVVTHRPRAGGGPPAAVAMILDAQVPAADLASLTSFATGAAPLDPDTQRRFEARYGIPVLLSYGATEFGGPVAAMTAELRAQAGAARIGSVGRAMPGVRLRVRDADGGGILGPGAEGLLEVVSPRVGPDWIATSDIAMIDADGFLFLRGRADGAILRGGFKLLPETIEAALLLHPAVSAAGVIGVADARLGAVPAAAIVPAPGAAPPTVAALTAHLRAQLPATHLPVHWRIVAELPRTGSFKVDRPALAALFAGTGTAA